MRVAPILRIVADQGLKQSIARVLPIVELVVALYQQRGVPGNRGGSHAGTVHLLVAIALHRAVGGHTLRAHRRYQASIVHRATAREIRQVAIGIHRPHVDHVFRATRATPVPSTAHILVVARREDMQHAGVLDGEGIDHVESRLKTVIQLALVHAEVPQR